MTKKFLSSSDYIEPEYLVESINNLANKKVRQIMKNRNLILAKISKKYFSPSHVVIGVIEDEQFLTRMTKINRDLKTQLKERIGAKVEEFQKQLQGVQRKKKQVKEIY